MNITHNTLIVTSTVEDVIMKVHARARYAMRELVTDLHHAPTGGRLSFAVLPHGSKAGFDIYTKAEADRQNLINLINAHELDDGTNVISFASLSFGDAGLTVVTNDADEQLTFIRRVGGVVG